MIELNKNENVKNLRKNVNALFEKEKNVKVLTNKCENETLNWQSFIIIITSILKNAENIDRNENETKNWRLFIVLLSKNLRDLMTSLFEVTFKTVFLIFQTGIKRNVLNFVIVKFAKSIKYE